MKDSPGVTNMQSNWKRILCLLTFLFVLNCAWVIRSREEIDRPQINLTPLPDSLLSLSDSSENKCNYVITFRINWRHSSFKQAQPVLTYAVREDGKFEATYQGHTGQENIDLGYLDRIETQHLIDTLNILGLFHINEDRLLYEHFDVEKVYLFGFLMKKKKQLMHNCPDNVSYNFDFRLKHITYKGNYCGTENVREKPEYVQELHILKKGTELIENFFEKKALEFSEKSYFSSLYNCQIIPECSLDTEVKFAQKTSTWVTLSARRDKGYTVVTKLLVRSDGQVIYGFIQNSSGYRYFDYKALYNIKRFKYSPPQYQSNSVYTWVTLPLQSITCSY
jgi:TonB family protein